MKKLAFIVAAASLFAFAPLADRFGTVTSSIVLVWFGVLLACFASGAINSLAIAGGALGAFTSGMLGATSPVVGSAVFVLAAFAERTMRVRSRTGRAVHAGIALMGGGLAGAVAGGASPANPPVYLVAALVGAVLVSLPLLVEADDPVAYALDQAAAFVSDPAQAALREGAELRRHTVEVPLDRETRTRVEGTWRSLLRLAEARVRLERARPRALGTATSAASVLGMIEERIVQHVGALTKAITAVDTVTAARIGVDDAALKEVASMGESLDEVSRALVEVRAEEEPPRTELSEVSAS